MKKSKNYLCIILSWLFFLFLFASLLFLLCGCATGEQLAKNLEAKSIVGDGFVAVSKISVSDPESGDISPMIKTVIVSGKMQTILKDANLLTYSRNSSASVFNASSVTTQEQLTISLPSSGNMAETVSALEKILTDAPEK